MLNWKSVTTGLWLTFSQRSFNRYINSKLWKRFFFIWNSTDWSWTYIHYIIFLLKTLELLLPCQQSSCTGHKKRVMHSEALGSYGRFYAQLMKVKAGLFQAIRNFFAKKIETHMETFGYSLHSWKRFYKVWRCLWPQLFFIIRKKKFSKLKAWCQFVQCLLRDRLKLLCEKVSHKPVVTLFQFNIWKKNCTCCV